MGDSGILQSPLWRYSFIGQGHILRCYRINRILDELERMTIFFLAFFFFSTQTFKCHVLFQLPVLILHFSFFVVG